MVDDSRFQYLIMYDSILDFIHPVNKYEVSGDEDYKEDDQLDEHMNECRGSIGESANCPCAQIVDQRSDS